MKLCFIIIGVIILFIIAFALGMSSGWNDGYEFGRSCDTRRYQGENKKLREVVGALIRDLEMTRGRCVELETKLQDEMYRHDRLQDFEVAESEKLAKACEVAKRYKAERDALQEEQKAHLATIENLEFCIARFKAERDASRAELQKVRCCGDREAAIRHFEYGVSHDIFCEPVRSYAKMAIAALRREAESVE